MQERLLVNLLLHGSNYFLNTNLYFIPFDIAIYPVLHFSPSPSLIFLILSYAKLVKAHRLVDEIFFPRFLRRKR